MLTILHVGKGGVRVLPTSLLYISVLLPEHTAAGTSSARLRGRRASPQPVVARRPARYRSLRDSRLARVTCATAHTRLQRDARGVGALRGRAHPAAARRTYPARPRTSYCSPRLGFKLLKPIGGRRRILRSERCIALFVTICGQNVAARSL
jgi:hypothetical protein